MGVWISVFSSPYFTNSFLFMLAFSLFSALFYSPYANSAFPTIADSLDTPKPLILSEYYLTTHIAPSVA